jgi:hypothetical protein
MVGLVEYLVRADAGGLDLSVALVVHGSGVDVDASDFAASDARFVNLAHAPGDVVGVVACMLAEDQDQPLVADLLEGLDLAAEFLGGQRPPHLLAVRPPEAAVRAIVDAVVADVERRKEDDAVAVDVALEPACRLKNLFHQRRVGCADQHGGFFNRQRLLGEALGDHFADARGRRRAGLDQTLQLSVVDEIHRPFALGYRCQTAHRNSPAFDPHPSYCADHNRVA